MLNNTLDDQLLVMIMQSDYVLPLVEISKLNSPNLEDRSSRIRKKFYKDIISCSDVCDMDPDMLLYNEYYWDMITSSRIRYSIYYITHCEKRIEGINWIINNRLKLSEYSRIQLFNLIKLKELLVTNEKEYYEIV